jgi:hypothetical protein
MESFQEIIGQWGTVAAFAADVGVKERTAMSWWQRQSIPADRFAAIVRAAARRGFSRVTPELLIEIAEGRQRRRMVA